MAKIVQCSAVQIFIRERFRGDLKLYGRNSAVQIFIREPFRGDLNLYGRNSAVQCSADIYKRAIWRGFEFIWPK
jgi:hypothetical protein